MSKSPITPENKIFVLFFGGLIIVILIIAGISIAFPNSPQVNLVNYGKINDFNLVNQDNQSVTLDSFNSSDVLVINFFYTWCGDLPNSTYPGCNAETAKLNTVMGALLDAKYTNDQFHFLSIDFDYRYDNVSTVEDYGNDRAVGAFDHWSFLTGNKSQILNVTSTYGFCDSFYHNQTELANNTGTCEQYAYLSSSSVAQGKSNSFQSIDKIESSNHENPNTNVSYGYIHSFLVIVADKNRNIRQLYTDPYWKASTMIDAIKALLNNG